MSWIWRSAGGSPPGYSMTGFSRLIPSIQHHRFAPASGAIPRAHAELAPLTHAKVMTVTVRDALLKDLDPQTLYRILRLRSEVFVVEQNCVYHDQDGRDAEPDARQ